MIDKKGQMSVEVIFLFAISIIILLAFTIPITNIVIQNNLDVVNSLNTKSNILEIATGIDNVYSQGMGAQQVKTIEADKDINVIIKPNSIHCDLLLNDGNVKKFDFTHKADNIISNFKLNKGINNVLISWPDDSQKIIIKNV